MKPVPIANQLATRLLILCAAEAHQNLHIQLSNKTTKIIMLEMFWQDISRKFSDIAYNE